MSSEILVGDCRELIAGMAEKSVHDAEGYAMSGKTDEWEDVWFVQYRRPGSVVSLAQCRQRDDGIEDLACKLQSAGWETRILHVEGDVLTERPIECG